MRKKITKFFALDYKVFIFGRLVSWTRSANVIFPLFLLCGFLTLNDSTTAYCLTPVAYCLLGLALFFGFIYFDLKPLTDADYDYLDEVQRFMYDYKNYRNPEPLEKYNSTWTFWVNPLAVISFLILYLCS
ncbi:hypothetical protein [Capnocytophaga stomatis]|uniref:hypothetical protein n=1 Tax=Capnocytophaga stomatis TaxID=1848904 RepID=UPI001AD4E65E|nr:hypothetical protein [Capnocytophaga stomatis]GIM49403.1 hypothetical protein CAPN003_08550 [Capnocytophaga stomatis]